MRLIRSYRCALADGFSRITDYDGNSSRSAYWWFRLGAIFPVALVYYYFFYSAPNSALLEFLSVTYQIYSTIFFISVFALMFRRSNDAHLHRLVPFILSAYYLAQLAFDWLAYLQLMDPSRSITPLSVSIAVFAFEILMFSKPSRNAN